MDKRGWMWLGRVGFVLGAVIGCGGGTAQDGSGRGAGSGGQGAMVGSDPGTSGSGAASGGSTSLVPSGTGSVALGSLAHEMGIALCNLMLRCLSTSIAGELGICDAEWEKIVTDQGVVRLTNAILAGRVLYDGAAMRACLDQYATVACDYSNEQALSAACGNALVGTVPPGGDCTNNNECSGITTAFCASNGSCPGRCETRRTSGQPCTEDSDCASGLGCSVDNATCVLAARTGELCGRSAGGAECGGLTFCQEETGTGLWRCRSPGGTPPAEGEACSLTETCQSGLVCTAVGAAVGGTGWVGQCQKLAVSGGPCRFGIPNPCPSAEYCPVPYAEAAASTAICTARVGPNQPCQNDIYDMCAAGSHCNGSNCVATQRIGGPCSTGTDCYSDRCSGGACVVPEDCAD